MADSAPQSPAPPPELRAGTGRADITDYAAGPVNDPLFAKALVLDDGAAPIALVSIDAVAVAEIGRVQNDFVPRVRARLRKEFGIEPSHLVLAASHCHGVVRPDIVDPVVHAVAEAWKTRTPAVLGAGAGYEDRIMENRRLRLRDGSEADVRRAYSLPPDSAVAGVGPVDPEIGILRVDRTDGRPLAVVFNFACHPIQGVPSGANTADISGFAAQTIEDALDNGAAALFLQGCAGDINPVFYDDAARPRDAVPLGTMLGASALKAWAGIQTRPGARIRVQQETLRLPRADLGPVIAAKNAEQKQLLEQIRPVSLDLKAFLQLTAKYALSPEFPSAASFHYRHERSRGRDALERLDARNRREMEQYRRNLEILEKLTRLRTNLELLQLHQAQNQAAGGNELAIELQVLRLGNFILATFPGELSVEIGLALKRRAPHPLTFIATCANGYIYYAPTARQLENRGNAQEDSDCLLAPEWQARFEAKIQEMLAKP